MMNVIPCTDKRCYHGSVWAHDLYDGPCRPEDGPTIYGDAFSMRRVACPTCKGRGEIPECPLDRIVAEL